MYRITDPKLFFFNQIEMRVDGGAGESGEELEEPGDELRGQLLSLDARLGRVDDPLVVLHILQQPKQTHNPSGTGTPAIACVLNKTLEKAERV